jgi:hypothetical protein
MPVILRERRDRRIQTLAPLRVTNTIVMGKNEKGEIVSPGVGSGNFVADCNIREGIGATVYNLLKI